MPTNEMYFSDTELQYAAWLKMVLRRGVRVARAEGAVLLHGPLGVVEVGEGADGVADLADGLENAAVDGLLLQGSEQPLNDAMGLRFSGEGVAGRYALELGLLPEVLIHEGAAMVVAEREAAGSARRKRWPNCWQTARFSAWIASKRVPCVITCAPRSSAFQCSATLKIQTLPC